eukprot:s4445_g4.t1
MRSLCERFEERMLFVMLKGSQGCLQQLLATLLIFVDLCCYVSICFDMFRWEGVPQLTCLCHFRSGAMGNARWALD